MGDYTLLFFHPSNSIGDSKRQCKQKGMKAFVMQDALRLHPTLGHIDET